MKQPIIQIRNLGKEFKTSSGTVRALEGINLDIYQGEIFGIIGLSGAGKSTPGAVHQLPGSADGRRRAV